MSLSRLSRATLLLSSMNKAAHHRRHPFLSSGYEYRSFVSSQGPKLRRSYNLHNSVSVASFRQYNTKASTEKKSQKMLYYLTGLVFGMVGLSYAAVPMYQRFCQATGYGGTIQRKESVEEKIARHSKDGTVTSREIVVQFNADVADGMPWKFSPTQREVRVKPGESALAFYTAENKSSAPITGVSTYNVTPMKAAVYFNKIQCFCFEEQKLLPGEQIDMPMLKSSTLQTAVSPGNIRGYMKNSTLTQQSSSSSSNSGVSQKSTTKENTRPLEFRLHTQQRAAQRAIFNSSVTTKNCIVEQYKKQVEKVMKVLEEEEVRMLRKEMIPRAQLMPLFDKPFLPQRSRRPLTVPREPSFLVTYSKHSSVISC